MKTHIYKSLIAEIAESTEISSIEMEKMNEKLESINSAIADLTETLQNRR